MVKIGDIEYSNIKIGGFGYTVVEVDNLARDRECLGASCGNNLHIEIDKDICKDLKGATLLHECIEQLNFIYELDLDHKEITILGNALHQIIKDNKDLIDEYYNNG